MLEIPHNEQIEQAVLCCMIIDNELAQEVNILSEDDFYNETHQFIFSGIKSLTNKKMQVDYITLHEELGQKVSIQDLNHLNDYFPIMSSFKQYVKQLKQLSEERKLLNLTDEIRDKIFTREENVVNFAEKEIFKIREGNLDKGFTTPKKLVMKVFEGIEERYQSKELSGLSTGFYDIDRMTDGLQKKDFIVIAGRPSMGKTALVLNIAQNAGLVGKTIAFFSLEMSEEQLLKRMLLSEARVSDLDIRAKRMDEGKWSKLANASSSIYETNINICDEAGLTVPKMLSKSRRLKRKEKKLDLVIIDYLQLIRGDGKNRTEQITNISISLKAMAKELDCPVVVLSQLSRECEKRPNKRPIMSDLRESGQIEQDADVIVFLYRDEYYNADTEKKNMAEIIFSKQRNGPVGTAELAFIRKIATFANLEKYRK